MKKTMLKLLKYIGKKGAINIYNSASLHYTYQPQEPEKLSEFVKRDKNRKV